jgi:hypothetical protein
VISWNKESYPTPGADKVGSLDLEQTRIENDRRLAGQLPEIRSGRASETLAAFAKAYLGLYLDIDNGLDPEDRVGLVASERLTEAVLEGFEASLARSDLPRPSEIAEGMSHSDPFPVGYSVLAGLDRLYRRSPGGVMALPDTTLGAGLCFHYANKTRHRDKWVEALLSERPQLAIKTLGELWSTLIVRRVDYLPAFQQVLGGEDRAAIAGQLVLPVLRQWAVCKARVLKVLLHSALRHADHAQLMTLVEARLEEGASHDVRPRVYWLATAFLLAPERYGQVLADYCSRSREKALPLLDFAVAALSPDKGQQLKLPPAALGQLLRILAPAFPRNEHMRGALDENSQKVLWLFDQLGEDTSVEAIGALNRLRRVRVMRTYADVLDRVETTQTQGQRQHDSARR